MKQHCIYSANANTYTIHSNSLFRFPGKKRKNPIKLLEGPALNLNRGYARTTCRWMHRRRRSVGCGRKCIVQSYYVVKPLFHHPLNQSSHPLIFLLPPSVAHNEGVAGTNTQITRLLPGGKCAAQTLLTTTPDQTTTPSLRVHRAGFNNGSGLLFCYCFHVIPGPERAAVVDFSAPKQNAPGLLLLSVVNYRACGVREFVRLL